MVRMSVVHETDKDIAASAIAVCDVRQSRSLDPSTEGGFSSSRLHFPPITCYSDVSKDSMPSHLLGDSLEDGHTYSSRA